MKNGTAVKKILYIISDTGGGHRSAANAIIATTQRAGSGASSEIIDLLRLSGLPGIQSAPEIYGFFSSGHIWLHNLLFRIFNNRKIMDLASNLGYRLAFSSLHRIIETSQPNLVVVIHPLAVRAICALRRDIGANWPVAVVVTDLVDIHASWASPEADLYLLPTEEAANRTIRWGVPRAKTVTTGFPVHPKFLDMRLTKEEARGRLGISSRPFTALVTSGGAGGGKIGKMVSFLENRCPEVQLLVVCGKNRSLFEALKERTDHGRLTRVFGYVNQMELLMAASNVIIGKAGPGTIMECAATKRPLLITGAVGLQERGNIGWACSHSFGLCCPSLDAIGEQLQQMSAIPQTAASQSTAPEQFTDGARRISTQLLELLRTRS